MAAAGYAVRAWFRPARLVVVPISPALPAGPAPGRITPRYQAVADAVTRAARPLLLSGDCPVALGAMAGLQRRHRDLAVVWLDAHGDFNTPAITISGYLGGMALAMLTGRAPEVFGDAPPPDPPSPRSRNAWPPSAPPAM